MNKDYNLGADVDFGFDREKIYGRKSDFKDVDEFKRYLIGEQMVDEEYIFKTDVNIVYMRYCPKGTFCSDNQPCYVECKKGKGATEYYVLSA